MTILFHMHYDDIPHYIMVGKKKKYLTNNVFYESTHFAVRKKIVDTCKLILYEKIRLIKPFDPKVYPVTIRLVYHSCKSSFDLDNKGSFWLKVFIDALRQRGVLPDDNIKFINKIHIEFYPLIKGSNDILEISISH